MIYLQPSDLVTDSKEKFIEESTADAENSPERHELKAIALVKTYLPSRYDKEAIFHSTTPIRNELLIDIITKIVLYGIFRRNAARRMPSDLKEDYDAAMKRLEKINAGSLRLDGLPLITDDTGNASSTSMWGNNSNRNFYI